MTRLEHQRVRAYVERDLETLDKVLSYDFLFTRSLGRAFNKPQLMEAIASGEWALEGYERNVQKVTVLYNTAVAIGYDRVRGRYMGQDISGLYHFSSIYVEHGGSWRVVAAHAYHVAEGGGAP